MRVTCRRASLTFLPGTETASGRRSGRALLRAAGVMMASAVLLAGCSGSVIWPTSYSTVAPGPSPDLSLAPSPPPEPVAAPAQGPLMAYADPSRSGVDELISYYAGAYRVPERLVRHVVERESRFNPGARNGPYMGLMQIHPTTARTMGYLGPPEGLLDPDTNLKFGVKYLAGAYLVAGGDEAKADLLYQTGYYYKAKRMGLLEETGLR